MCSCFSGKNWRHRLVSEEASGSDGGGEGDGSGDMEGDLTGEREAVGEGGQATLWRGQRLVDGGGHDDGSTSGEKVPETATTSLTGAGCGSVDMNNVREEAGARGGSERDSDESSRDSDCG